MASERLQFVTIVAQNTTKCKSHFLPGGCVAFGPCGTERWGGAGILLCCFRTALRELADQKDQSGKAGHGKKLRRNSADKQKNGQYQ